MSEPLKLLAEQAASYNKGGMPLTIAAAQALNEISIPFADMHQTVTTCGTLFGYSPYLVPLGKTVGGTTRYKELRAIVPGLEPTDFMTLTACMRLLIRVEATRLLLWGGVEALGPVEPLVPQEVAGPLTLREIALFCANDHTRMRATLTSAINRSEMTLPQLYAELYAGVQTSTLNSVVFRPETDTQEMLVYAMAGCTPLNEPLLLEIADYALSFYHIHATRWNDEARYTPRDQPTTVRRRTRIARALGWPWFG